jgi:hypothetical protein
MFQIVSGVARVTHCFQTEGWNSLLDVLGSVWNPILPKGRRNFTFGRLEVPFGTQIIQIEPKTGKQNQKETIGTLA